MSQLVGSAVGFAVGSTVGSAVAARPWSPRLGRDLARGLGRGLARRLGRRHLRLLAPGELRAVAGGLRDPVERARVAGAAFAAESFDGAGRGQRVVAAAALRKKTRSRAVGKADAGQTLRSISLPVTYKKSLPSFSGAHLCCWWQSLTLPGARAKMKREWDASVRLRSIHDRSTNPAR